MKTRTSMLLGALAAAAALSAAPLIAEARPGGGGNGGGGGGGSPGFRQGGGGGYHGGYHGGYRGGNYGYRGGYYGRWYRGWGYRPYYPAYWGIGLGLAAIAYSAPYYGYYGGYYAYPGYVAPVAEYVVADPAPGDRVVRSGQPVPASTPPDPIFYPRNGQTPAQTETDRLECNRWATTQAGAMSDASVFQRATYACMEGRGYTVR